MSLSSLSLISLSTIRACFKSYAFRMRVKADTYNDETRVKHTVMG